MQTALEIATWACSEKPSMIDLERVILRYAVQQMEKAAKAERGVCQELAARYGGSDAEAIAELIGQRNFKL